MPNLVRTVSYRLRFEAVHTTFEKFVFTVKNRKFRDILRYKPKLQELAEGINNTCQKNGTKFKISWIARNQSSIADNISKTIDYDDCQKHSHFINTCLKFKKI